MKRTVKSAVAKVIEVSSASGDRRSPLVKGLLVLKRQVGITNALERTKIHHSSPVFSRITRQKACCIGLHFGDRKIYGSLRSPSPVISSGRLWWGLEVVGQRLGPVDVPTSGRPAPTRACLKIGGSGETEKSGYPLTFLLRRQNGLPAYNLRCCVSQQRGTARSAHLIVMFSRQEFDVTYRLYRKEDHDAVMKVFEKQNIQPPVYLPLPGDDPATALVIVSDPNKGSPTSTKRASGDALFC